MEKEEVMTKETLHVIARNTYWKSQLHWTLGEIVKGMGLDANVDVETKLFVDRVKSFQKTNGLTPDGIIGPSTYEAVKAKLGIGQSSIDKVVAATMAKESGGNYAALNLDGEFRGRFDTVWVRRTGSKHPASGKIHIGLSAFAFQNTQDGGSLGAMLKAFLSKNPDKFKRIVGDTWQELINITNNSGPSGLSTGTLRGPRVQKVKVKIGQGELDYRDLWEDPWIDIFKRLGNDSEFQSVQNRLAVDIYLKPISTFLKTNKLLSEASVAVGFDLAVHRGVGGARKYITARLGSNEQETLSNLSRDNERSMSILKGSLSTTGEWDGWREL